MTTIIELLGSVDWAALISGAILGALGLAVRTVIQAPVKALTEHASVVRFLSVLSPQRPFGGLWHVAWKVDSRRFPEINEDTVRMYRLFSNVTFTTVATLRDGSSETCVFVGKLIDRTITGRWYNPADENLSYFGSFQLRLHGSLRSAVGSWLGWSNEGAVQTNEIIVERRETGERR